MTEPLALTDNMVEAALAAGASDADATLTIAKRFSTEARARTIEKLERATSRTLSLRVFVDGGKATLTTSDFSEDGLRRLVGETVAAARHVTNDPLAGLPERAETPPALDLQIEDPEVQTRDDESKLGDALALESTARSFDARIVNSGGSRVSDSTVTTALTNSRGFRGQYTGTSVARSTNPIAADGDQKRTSSYGSAARGYRDVEPVESIATLAARRAVESIGAHKPPSMRCPVIFERDVAGQILSDLFNSISAQNVAIGNSFLIDRIGSKIGSDLVTIVDDGLLPRGLGSSPFDAEGVPTRLTTVFEGGVLRTYLYDTYYGRKLGAASTGNSSGSGIGPNNFFLLPGTQTLEELIAATERGVLILDTIGFATEYVTGTYSRGAHGFLIEKGELAAPIDEFTIAGNLGEMLASIDAVAADLRFDSSTVSPSFRVREMTVSGN